MLIRDVKIEYKILKEKVKEYNKRDAKFYGNIFAKWGKLEHMEANVRLIFFFFCFLFFHLSLSL